MNTSKVVHIMKDHALLEEIEASSKMIVLGLGEIQNISNSNKFYFLPLQLLAGGYEKLLKCMVCLGYYNKHGVYPQDNYLKNKLSHNIERILGVIMMEYFSDKTPMLKEHRTFLENNKDLKKILVILSEFAQIGRYGNLNVVTGKDKPFTDAINKWEAFEAEPLYENPELLEMLGKIGQEEFVYQKLERRIVIILEQFTHILAMQFTIGNLGDLARKYYGPLHHFFLLKDFELGRHDYRGFHSWYQKKTRIKHQSNWFGYFKRRLNPKIKWMVVRQSDYIGEWPYYVNKVIIECHQKYWCVVCINGRSYALNGAAKGRFNLQDAYEAGMAIPGIFPHTLIKISQSL
jgi:hypothetical protein